MAGYKDLLALIRKGTRGAEILRRLDIPPSRLRRLLGSKRLWQELKLERELSSIVIAHSAAGSVKDMVDRLVSLAHSESEETSRKACLAMVAEGLRCVRTPKSKGKGKGRARRSRQVAESLNDPPAEEAPRPGEVPS